ncbi:MAG: VWA domain-containing protein [Pseudomonadota bacterium]
MLPDLAALEHFHFLRPLWALAIIPWLIITWVQSRRQVNSDMFGGIIAPHLLAHLRLSRFQSRWFNPVSLSRVVAVLMLIILMGPSWRQQPSPLNQDEAALVVLLDVSSSMAQRDVQPSRLQRAKQKIGDLLALRPDKKTALIVYAGSAHTVLSLTADQEILKQYLAAIEPGIMPRAGKFPEYALPLVDEVLRESEAPATVMLFTDGLGTETIAQFGDYFDRSAHQLLIEGVGREQVEEGIAPLERRALEDLASTTGGHYQELSVDDSDVRALNRHINSHYVVKEDSALPWLDSGYQLVFVALALFLMWFRRGWTLTWAWLLLPVMLTVNPGTALAQLTESKATPVIETEAIATADSNWSALKWFADLWLTGDQQGRLLLQQGDYLAAAARFDDPMWKGIGYYYGEEFMLAAEYFSRSDSDDALFNEANARAQARDYVRAVNRYDRLLARSPDYPGAMQNRDNVQAIIDEINRLSESQQSEPGDGGNNNELSSEDAIAAQGAEEMVWEQAQTVTLTAEDILQDPETANMWMRSVQQDPSNFLAIKFSMQLQGRVDGEAASP